MRDGLSAREAKAQSQALRREREAHLRQRALEGLRALREAYHVACVARDAKLAEIARECRAQRIALGERAHERRTKLLAELRATYAKERDEARLTRIRRETEARASARDPIAEARGKWDAERRYMSDLRRIERGNRERHRAAKIAHASERKSESDDAVRANLPADYLALFERVKRTIKGSAHESRTEAFLRYAETRPNEVVSALEDEGERKFRALQADHARAERAARARPRYTPEELAEVPF